MAALDQAHREPMEVVIAGRMDSEDTAALLSEIHQRFLPHRALSMVVADPALPLNAGCVTVDGKSAAYVCKAHACAAPVTTREALVPLLS